MWLRFRQALEGPLCRTVGCSSIFAKWFEWPLRRVCWPMTEYLFKDGGPVAKPPE